MFLLPGGLGLATHKSSPGFSNSTSVLFDGVDDYVSFGNNFSLDLTANELTVSAWFKVTDISVQRYIAARARPGASAVNWILAVNTDGTLFGYFGGVGGFSTSGGSISINTWYHALWTNRNVSGAYKGSIWLNGTQVGIDVVSGSMTDATSIAKVGAAGTGATAPNPFKGNIDEVTFWNAGFQASNVTALYNSGKPNDPTTHTKAANLTNWYRMGDGDTYPTITDHKGAISGTCTNMVSGANNFVASVP